jgi:hypothetical protein
MTLVFRGAPGWFCGDSGTTALSDYRVDAYIQAYLHGSSSRSVHDLHASRTVLRDEEVRASRAMFTRA